MSCWRLLALQGRRYGVWGISLGMSYELREGNRLPHCSSGANRAVVSESAFRIFVVYIHRGAERLRRN